MLIPFESVAVPLFHMFNGRRNTLRIQALPFIANAFAIYRFHTFFRRIPKSIEEAARLDGAGPWRTFFAITVPMSKSVFASVAMLTFLTQWGFFLWPVLMVSAPSVRPLPLEISVFQGQQPPDWGQILAFGVLLVLPVLMLFAFFQCWFVQGVAGSGVRQGLRAGGAGPRPSSPTPALPRRLAVPGSSAGPENLAGERSTADGGEDAGTAALS
jgi:multiple sugar transport system permease protein